MGRGKKRSWTDDQLRQAVKVSHGFHETAKVLGLRPAGGTYTGLKNACLRLGLDVSHFHNPGIGISRKTAKKDLTEVFIVGSKYGSCRVRRPAMRHLDKIPYRCECGNIGEWCGKKLTLVLDHKNGINNDNRFDNLRFLCPNCHSQTETFAGRNMKKRRGIVQRKDPGL